MIDKTLLQVVKYRQDYEKYRPMVKDHVLDDTTITLIRDFNQYFDKYPDHTVVDFGVFSNWFKQFRHPNMKKEELAFYDKVFPTIEKDAPESLSSTLKQDMQHMHYATLLANKTQDMLDGKIDGVKLVEDVNQATEKVMEQMAMNKDVVWDTEDFAESASATSYESGLKFKLECLDQSIGSLHPSKFLIVGAYVDTGKSTFLADQFGASMFRQIVAECNRDKWFYGRPIIWFNNEGSTRDIKMYFHQSLLNSSSDVIRNRSTEARAAYDKMDQERDLFRVVPCQGWHIREAEHIIKTYKPAIVIYDMLDNFRGFEDAERGDQRYRYLYDHARQMADQHQHVAIGTSQCVGDAEGLERIPMSYLEGSRVAKQSTADGIIMLGRSLESGKQNSRYIFTPKNKFNAQPNKAFDRMTNTEVIFDGECKRFRNPGEEAELGG